MNERGTAMVELALVMPLLLVMVLGTVDVGRSVVAHLALEEAVHETAMFASYHGGELTDTPAQTVLIATSSTDSITIDPAAVTITCSTGVGQLASLETVRVDVTHVVTPITPFANLLYPTGIHLSASAEGKVFSSNCLATP